MRVHLALLAVVVTAASSAQSSWEKVMLTEAASKSSAVCLDGSPGGYFLRKVRERSISHSHHSINHSNHLC